MLLLSALSLAACTETIYTSCPPIADYSKEFQMQWAKEIESFSEDSAIIVVTKDYITLRKQLKACRTQVS